MDLGHQLRERCSAQPDDPAAIAIYRDWLVEELGWTNLGENAYGCAVCRLPAGPVVLWIPSGTFWRGSRISDVDAERDELPRSQVTVDGFWIGRDPVTWGQYRDYAAATGAPLPEPPYIGGDGPVEDHPVVSVNWYEAAQFCEWAGGRLPSDAEWEKAARGAAGRDFPWGYSFEEGRCNSAAEGLDHTTPIGRYPSGASSYGCLDMAGNVDEWCADWFERRFNTSTSTDNPRGPRRGTARILRGGSYNDVARAVRGAHRKRRSPSTRSVLTGFRLAI